MPVYQNYKEALHPDATPFTLRVHCILFSRTNNGIIQFTSPYSVVMSICTDFQLHPIPITSYYLFLNLHLHGFVTCRKTKQVGRWENIPSPPNLPFQTLPLTFTCKWLLLWFLSSFKQLLKLSKNYPYHISQNIISFIGYFITTIDNSYN